MGIQDREEIRCPKHKGGGNPNQTRDKKQNTEEVGMQDREGIGYKTYKGGWNTSQGADEM